LEGRPRGRPRALEPVGINSGSIKCDGSISSASSKGKSLFKQGFGSGSGNAVLARGRETATSAGAVQSCTNNNPGRRVNFKETATSGVRGPATQRWLLPRFTGSGGARWSRPDPHCPSLGPSARLLPWPGWPTAPDPLGVLPVSLLDSTSEHYIQCEGCGEWLQVHRQVITIYREPQNMAFFCRYLTGKACQGDFRNPPGMSTKSISGRTKKKRHRRRLV